MDISIHAPREGGDVSPPSDCSKDAEFQSTPPARGATPGGFGRPAIFTFQSTPPARGATASLSTLTGKTIISIHAPREGGDSGGRLWVVAANQFQSTPPARGATVHFCMLRPGTRYFNPRPPRGGRPQLTATFIKIVDISIHAPREGGDPDVAIRMLYDGISIHAPREGGDSKDAQFYLRILDKQVELLRFLGKMRGGCLRNPEKDRRFLGKSLANLPEISGRLDFAGGGKAHPGYPCAVPLLRRAACVRGSGDPPADRCSSYRNAPLFSHIASPDSRSADCLSQNP